MKKLLKIFMMLASISLLISCAKDGETGPQGPAGVNGTNGTNGQDGNANVHTQTFTVSNWYYIAPSYGVDIADFDITQDIVDNGLVMVYTSNGSGGWQALPYTAYPSSSYSSTYVFVHYLNGVTIWKTDSDLTQPVNPGTRTYKVIAVAEAPRIANPNVNWNNYEEVKETFNLKD
ncbi:MAG: collagen-like protein [Bacteroidia bacterium]